MYIQRVVVKNYRCLKSANVTFNERLNVIVGSNECGKSTLLEAVHLALTGQLNGRPLIVELHPYLFNFDLTRTYFEALKAGTHAGPPSILIELYLADDPALAKLKGDNNSLRLDVPGVSMLVEMNPSHADDFAQYISEPSEIRTLPVEYFWIKWRDFADNEIINSRGVPVQTSLIDASTIKNNAAANRYVVDIIKESLTSTEKVDLALS